MGEGEAGGEEEGGGDEGGEGEGRVGVAGAGHSGGGAAGAEGGAEEEGAAAEGLERTGVVRVEGGEGGDLGGGEFEAAVEDEPVDAFGAGRGGEGAFVAVVGAVGGKQGGGIQRDAADGFGVAFVGGQVGQHRGVGRVLRALVDQRPNDGQFTVGALVDEVDFQRGILAVEGVLALGVEVELGEGVGFALDGN